MPEITPEQALCALMLGTGETTLILDAEIIRAIRGVNMDVIWHEESHRWEIVFRGMPDKSLLEAKGVKTPDVANGYILGHRAELLDHPRRDINPRPIKDYPCDLLNDERRPGTYEAKYGVPFDPGPNRDRDHDPVPEEEIPKGQDRIGDV